jgi:NADH dehydrogenase
MPAKHPGTSVVIVGGGFAGVACAKTLAAHDVAVTLIDKHNYQQFQPLLYQVATGMLAAPDVARPLRGLFHKELTVRVKEAEIDKVDPAAKTVTTVDGTTFTGDYLVLAMGAQPNFFGTPGAEENAFPLYSLDDAERLRSRVFQVLEDADLDPNLVERGALNFVVIGGGATGVETAGALADLVNEVLPRRFRDLPLQDAHIHVVDLGETLLNGFADESRTYAARVLGERGVQVHLGVSAKRITADRVVLSDGSHILTRTVVWGGGLQAAELAGSCGVVPGKGGRIDVEADLSIAGLPGVFAAGDVANIPGADGRPLPQLGSVALQAGGAAARSIIADVERLPRPAFHYRDKGIMAMIGRRAAVAQVGKKPRVLTGRPAFLAWLGVHAYLLSGFRERADAFVAWGWDYLSKSRATSVIDRPGAARIDWSRVDEGS